MVDTVESLQQHQLRRSPLTEFELAYEVSEHSGYSREQASDKMSGWLDELRAAGLVWAGVLVNANGQQLMAAALTRRGKELVN